MVYVTDTHPLIYLATYRLDKLGRKARRVFRGVDEGKHVIVVPVTVLEEILRLLEKRVLRLSIPFPRWAEELERSPNFQIQAYNLEVLLEAVSLSSIRDPADRIIVATARHLSYPLISADEAIQKGDWVETAWE